MAVTTTFHPVLTAVFWPARATLAEFTAAFNGEETRGRDFRVALSYVPVALVGELTFVANSWSLLSFEWEFPFNGSPADFTSWARTSNGTSRLVDETIKLQNLLIDHIKAAHPYDSNTQNIRHFGPSEWPYFKCSSGAEMLIERANPALRAELASVPLITDLSRFRDGSSLPITLRGLLRACDLVDCGYPTEALLVAIAIFDAALQHVLIRGMGGVGIQSDSAESLLRNTTQSRFATYLDPVLKLVYGRSLREDDPTLFQKVIQVNSARNEAIHRGVDIARSAAREACTTIYDVLDYLNQVYDPMIELPPRPQFSS